MPKPQTFSAESFTPTKFCTAQQKADFANHLLGFIDAGFPEKKFTRAFYEHLSMCFSFIAHNDRQGFYATYFTCAEDKMSFLTQIANAPCYGSAEYTFSDVERAVGELIRTSGWLSVYATNQARENESRERAMLATLPAKYQVPASTEFDDLEPRPFPAIGVPGLPPEHTQFSLFG